MNDLQVRIADWHKDNADLRRIRESVFIQEQGVAPRQSKNGTVMMRAPPTFLLMKVILLSVPHAY